jgi:MFS family permease
VTTGLSAWRGTIGDAKLKTLIVMSFIDSLGTAIYVAGSVIYFTKQVGLSGTEVGLGLSVASVVGLAGVIPAGWVAERFGTRRTLLVFHLWRASALASFVFVHSFPWFLVVVCLLSVPEQAFNPLIQHFVEQLVGPAARTITMGKIKTVYNVGFTIGAPLSALAVKFNTPAGYNSLVLADALTYVVVVVILYRFRTVPSGPELGRGADHSERHPRFSIAALRDRNYRRAATVNSVMSLHLSILTVGIPLWVTLHTHLPRYSLGLLFAVNTALVILLQVPINSLANSVDRSLGLMRGAGVSLAACCLLLAWTTALPLALAVAALAAAVILLTLGEMAQSAAGWALAYELAPPMARAEWLTTFWVGISAQFVIGPLLVSGVIVANRSLGWAGLGLAFLLFTLYTSVTQRRRTRAELTTSPQPARP